MNAVTNIANDTTAGPEGQVFPEEARTAFAAAYPEQPLVIPHRLRDHPLLGLDALADLAGRLPESSIEYNRGDLPIGIDGKPGATGLSITDTIHRIAGMGGSTAWEWQRQLRKECLGGLILIGDPTGTHLALR